MKRKIDDKGVIGFYEDVPALLIVVVGTIIFLSSMYGAIERHNESSSISDFDRKAIEFAQAVRSSPLLLYKEKIGQFDGSKVKGLDSENLTNSLHPDFYYSVNLTDVSNYSVKYNKTWARTPEHNFTRGSYEKGRKVVHLSVTVVVNPDEVHSAKLRVEVWK